MNNADTYHRENLNIVLIGIRHIYFLEKFIKSKVML